MIFRMERRLEWGVAHRPSKAGIIEWASQFVLPVYASIDCLMIYSRLDHDSDFKIQHNH